MSGHSKWSTIKRKKGAIDAQRSKVFTKIIKEITVAAKMGGSAVNANPRLRTAVEWAKSENMPADNIARAIKKGAGELENVSYEEIVYEGYGPAGTAVIIECLTDNRNRTAASVRTIFNKCGCSLGNTNSVLYMFDRKGVIAVPKDTISEDTLTEHAIEAGSEDIQTNEDTYTVYTAPADLHKVADYLDGKGVKTQDVKIGLFAQNAIVVNSKEGAMQVMRFIEMLEDDDDVQNVHTNFDISEELLTELYIGIDPGSRITGYGVLENSGNRISLVTSGTIKTNPEEDIARRLLTIKNRLEDVISEFNPTDAGVEAVFHSVNARSSLILGQARGVILVTLAAAGIAVREFSPKEIKLATVGYGSAEKSQIQQMVRLILNTNKTFSEDEADAVAAGICLINSVYDQDLIVLAGGVGYEIYLGSAVLQRMNIKVGNNIKLHADTVVREDSIRIYGFETDTAKTFFRLLLSVSGIGPKLAMTVIGHVGVSRIIQSVKTGNYQVFEDVPGIGKKSAQKIVIELEAKLRKLSVPIDLSSGKYSRQNLRPIRRQI
ncbi:hypothetical protein CHS0354_006874 [Potamilus streckersoni]|uniref:Helix-hairpin-helix DNA-binding motif class 1 domain-containing protein n=1 Tax=Potamilus streckersoni TaxID=2493646 RepID=A0AAE0WB58_9BIVA|nr:hypothetical protein CHS0354_006874 [Potamilus streckersoni]